jgi:adenosylcobinamide-GDP ribazoletransferase
MMLQPFFIAVQFLTRLPVPSTRHVNASHVGYSVLFYPLVGLIIGAALVALHWLLIGTSMTLAAALIVVCWIIITGGLHLDGLADSADAWVGGLGNHERTLAIMKDPCCGPMGVVALVAVLIVKFAALTALVTTGDWIALLIAPVLARTALPALFVTTPYVRANGLGTPLVAHLPRRSAIALVCTVLAAVPLLAGTQGLWMLLSGIALFVTLRTMMIRRIGGTTGDTAGALVELLESTTLVFASFAS